MSNILALLSDYTFQVVAAGTGMLGLLSGIIGSFAVLRQESLLGDALSHAALPGIVIGFLLIGEKNWIVLLLGAAISGLFATGLINWMTSRAVKLDNALSLILTSFFGFGLVLLTQAQKIPNANQAGLENFIYGQASSMLIRDVYAILFVGVICLFIIILFWKELKIFTFDANYADTLGVSSSLMQFIFSSILVLVVILGLESVGVILMSALLIAPAVAARQWTNKLHVMVILAGVFGAVSGVFGTVFSSLGTQMPTGPMIVVVASIIVSISLLFAPQRGLISRQVIRRKREQRFSKVLSEAQRRGQGKL